MTKKKKPGPWASELVRKGEVSMTSLTSRFRIALLTALALGAAPARKEFAIRSFDQAKIDSCETRWWKVASDCGLFQKGCRAHGDVFTTPSLMT